MTQIKGKCILITGGASGIGKLMTQSFGQKQARSIIVWDIDEEKLSDLGANWNFESHLLTQVVDITNPADVEMAIKGPMHKMEHLDILINNAGVVGGKSFIEQNINQIKNTIEVNVLGAMYVTRFSLPIMGSGSHIINIASAASYTPNPNMSVYASSKWAMLGWSESLRLELKQNDPFIRVTTICPSYIDTGMFHGAKAPVLTYIMKPEVAVSKVIRAIEKNRRLIRMPAMVNLLPLLRGILPGKIFDILIGKWFGIYSSMNAFKGRN